MNGDRSIWHELAKEKMETAFHKAHQSGKPEDKEEYERLKNIYYTQYYESSDDDGEDGKWSGDDTGWGFSR